MKIVCHKMVMALKVIFVIILLYYPLGCTTTEQSRQLALELSQQLDSYIKDRRAAINSLNESYRTTYSVLLNEHRKLTADRLRMERRGNARAMADAMLLDWRRKTTFSAIAAELEANKQKQLLAIQQRAEAIANARQQYLKSYSEIKLDLKKLEQAKRNLVDLSEEENTRRRTLELLIMIGKAYEDVRKESNQ